MMMLLDIEGTTTSISFVYDVLFPYARKHCAPFLEFYGAEPDIRSHVWQIATEANLDADAGLAVVRIPQNPTNEDVVRSVLSQMDLDRKNRGLKSLQGAMWREGYRSGEIRGHVYDDVPEALRRWNAAGIPVYIYSSGSVDAQKLLFGHSVAGDLLPFIAGHFDTEIGGKRDAASYTRIAKELNTAPAEITFATDNIFEADAAREAGMNVLVLDRPGNPATGPHTHVVIPDFTSIP